MAGVDERNNDTQADRSGDRIPVGEKCAYSMGVVSDHFAQFSIHAFLFPFFNVALGVKPSVIGWAMGLARLWDAFNDPIVGNLSDNWRGRLGRRRPFLLLGALLTGLVFPLIWLMPADWASAEPLAVLPVPRLFSGSTLDFEVTPALVWLSVALVVYYTAYSLLSVPYESLGMELTPDYQERTNLFAFRTYIMKVFDFVNQWLLPLAMWLAAGMAARELLGEVPALVEAGALDPTLNQGGYEQQLELLKSDRTEAMLLRVVPWVGVGVGLFIILSGILPALFCRERNQEFAQRQQKENPLKSLWSLAGNLPFWVVTGSIAIYLLGVVTNATLGFYVHTYFICGGKLEQGATLGGLHGTVSLVFSFFGAWFIQRLSRRIDKKPLLIGCVSVMLLSTAAWAVTYVPGGFYLTLATRPFISIAETGFWVLLVSMRADVADWDEYRTGQRREGVIAALGNWQVKMAITVAAVAGAYLLQSWVGFDADLGVHQEPGTLPRLKWTYVVLQTSTTAVVLGILLWYPLSRGRLEEVRAVIEGRRSANPHA